MTLKKLFASGTTCSLAWVPASSCHRLLRAGSSSSNFKIDRSIPGAQVPDELLKHSGALPVGAPIIRVRPTGGPARLHRMCIRTMAMLMYFRFADGIDCPLGEVVTVSQFKQQGAVL
jgi:hypothetical protein